MLLIVFVALLALFPEEATNMAVNAERSASGLQYESVVIDNETWHYLDGGSEDAEVLLLIHGFGGDKDNWTRFARSLTNNYRVIAPDLPGFGESVWHPDRDYSLFPQRDRIHDFLRALNIETVHLAGNSMGGNLAALYTHRYPQQVKSLALLNNSGVSAPVENEFQRAMANGENWLIIDSKEDFDSLLAFVAYKKPFLPWPAKDVFAQRAVDHAHSNRSILASYRGDRSAGLEPILEEIAAPVLIIWGEFDRILDVSSVDVMRPLMPQAEVVIMRDTGHIPMVERPSQTASLYRAFLEKIEHP